MAMPACETNDGIHTAIMARWTVNGVWKRRRAIDDSREPGVETLARTAISPRRTEGALNRVNGRRKPRVRRRSGLSSVSSRYRSISGGPRSINNLSHDRELLACGFVLDMYIHTSYTHS